MTQSGTHAMVKYVSFICHSNTSIPETPVVATYHLPKDAGGVFFMQFTPFKYMHFIKTMPLFML